MLKRCVAVCARTGCRCAVGRPVPGAWTLPQGTGQWLTTRHRQHVDQRVRRQRRLALDAALQQSRAAAPARIRPHRPVDRDLSVPACSTSTSPRRPAPSAPASATPSSAGAIAFCRTTAGCCPARRRCGFPGTTDTSNPAAIGYTDVEADFRVLLGHSFMLGGMPAFFDVEVAAAHARRRRAQRVPRRRHARRAGAAALAAAGAKLQCHLGRRGQPGLRQLRY